MDRRTFLEFLGKGVVMTAISPSILSASNSFFHTFKGISPSDKDELKLAKGLSCDILIKWEDPISVQDTFGFNNDYTAFLPFDPAQPNDGILWVNHEYVDPMFVSNYIDGEEKTKEQIQKEQYNVGGSIIRIKKTARGKWKVQENDPINKRITGQTEIPFNWPQPIAGKNTAIGTLANCSGGITPWGTILTCEENYDMFYGERNFKDGSLLEKPSILGWQKQFDNPPEHYGWVVEVDPKTGIAQKHIALGRCAHECATVKELPDGRVVVYSGDDSMNECLYKFVGTKPGSLSEGKLYVANLRLGQWTSLNYDDNPVLQKKFKDQTEVLIRMREAAKLVGGTGLDRPEDIEIDPITGHVLVSLTCLLYTSPSPRDATLSRMPSSA